MSEKLYRFTYHYQDQKNELKRVEYVVTRQTETHIYFRDGDKEARCRKMYIDQPRMRIGNYKSHLNFEMMTWNPHAPSARQTIVEHIDRTIIERVRKAEENLDNLVDFHAEFERYCN